MTTAASGSYCTLGDDEIGVRSTTMQGVVKHGCGIILLELLAHTTRTQTLGKFATTAFRLHMGRRRVNTIIDTINIITTP